MPAPQMRPSHWSAATRSRARPSQMCALHASQLPQALSCCTLHVLARDLQRSDVFAATATYIRPAHRYTRCAPDRRRRALAQLCRMDSCLCKVCPDPGVNTLTHSAAPAHRTNTTPHALQCIERSLPSPCCDAPLRDSIDDYQPNYSLIHIVAAYQRNTVEEFRLREGQLSFKQDRASLLGEGGSGKVFRGAHRMGRSECWLLGLCMNISTSVSGIAACARSCRDALLDRRSRAL